MDRLLEGEELNLLPLAEYTKQLLKAQDAKTASLVAQEIFKKLDEAMDRREPSDFYSANRRLTMSIDKYQAIKSEWGIE